MCGNVERSSKHSTAYVRWPRARCIYSTVFSACMGHWDPCRGVKMRCAARTATGSVWLVADLHVAASFHVYTAHCAHATESMVNSRAKCLAINQVLRTKSYNSCLIFVSYKIFYYYVVPFSFLLFLTYTSIWTHKYLCFHIKLGAKIRAKLSSISLLSPPHQQKYWLTCL